VENDSLSEKPSVTLPATVEKIIKSPISGEPEKAQIAIKGADDLYREIRIENAFENQNGEKVRVKRGAQVEVKLEADPKDVAPPPPEPDRVKS
jgi:hypothetical protein